MFPDVSEPQQLVPEGILFPEDTVEVSVSFRSGTRAEGPHDKPSFSIHSDLMELHVDQKILRKFPSHEVLS